jgi:hypothetical protein
MAESTLVPISIGLFVAVVVAAVGLGITWGKMRAEHEAVLSKLSSIEKSIVKLDHAGSRDIEAVGQRCHDLSSKCAMLELRVALLERELGVPGPAPEDRTPVRAMPRRGQLPTGPHGPVDAGDSR